VNPPDTLISFVNHQTWQTWNTKSNNANDEKTRDIRLSGYVQRNKIYLHQKGNICRSPLAKAVFQHEVNQANLSQQFEIDSCGTGAYHIGKTCDSRTRTVLEKHGINITHSARQLSTKDFDVDYLFVMDEMNLEHVTERKPKGSKAIIQLFGDFDPHGDRIIVDPYYGSVDGFERNFQQVTRCSRSFLAKFDK
jgi:low molecular weight phosphotyrosine protein phosphatase